VLEKLASGMNELVQHLPLRLKVAGSIPAADNERENVKKKFLNLIIQKMPMTSQYTFVFKVQMHPTLFCVLDLGYFRVFRPRFFFEN
jgi:hypothetical protein